MTYPAFIKFSVEQKDKNFVCIFAHPDDEAFGPSGTIIKLAKDFNMYLICVTRGEAGQNSLKEQKELGKIREEELKECAKFLGMKKVFFLDFIDGTLSNSLYHELAEKIEKILIELKPTGIMTFESRGISGHLDHIAVSMATQFVFQKLLFINELWQHCLAYDFSVHVKNYFIFFPPGYHEKEVHKIVDISNVWEKKIEAMKIHKSQEKDGKRLLKLWGNVPKQEYFLITKHS